MSTPRSSGSRISPVTLQDAFTDAATRAAAAEAELGQVRRFPAAAARPADGADAETAKGAAERRVGERRSVSKLTRPRMHERIASRKEGAGARAALAEPRGFSQAPRRAAGARTRPHSAPPRKRRARSLRRPPPRRRTVRERGTRGRRRRSRASETPRPRWRLFGMRDATPFKTPGRDTWQRRRRAAREHASTRGCPR